MAILTTKTVVCDVDRKESDGLVTVTLTVDGRRAKQILCPRHAAKYDKLLEEMGGKPIAGRGKVTSMEEIAARKRTTRKR